MPVFRLFDVAVGAALHFSNGIHNSRSKRRFRWLIRLALGPETRSGPDYNEKKPRFSCPERVGLRK
jgi:hypothetical protein